MSRKPREEIFDPFLTLDEYGRSEYERNEAWTGECWAYYINGGGGDPVWFDYWTYLQNIDRQRIARLERSR
jgi:hypothetical protein